MSIEELLSMVKLDSKGNVVDNSTGDPLFKFVDYVDEDGTKHTFSADLLRKLLLVRREKDSP